MRHLVSTVFLAFLAFAATAPAFAGDRYHRPSDRVVLTLTAEDWVETETARVRVAVDSAMSAGEIARARGRILATLSGLAPDVDWHVTRFARSRDKAGLERWHLEAEARVPEPGLAGLHERAEEASRPGEQVRVLAIDFTPTMAERERVLAALRTSIYAQAKEELRRLNAVYGDRAFRVKTIDFMGLARPMPVHRREAMMEPLMMEKATAEMAAAAPAPMGVAQRLQLRATVVLAAVPPGLKDKDQDG